MHRYTQMIVFMYMYMYTCTYVMFTCIIHVCMREFEFWWSCTCTMLMYGNHSFIAGWEHAVLRLPSGVYYIRYVLEVLSDVFQVETYSRYAYRLCIWNLQVTASCVLLWRVSESRLRFSVQFPGVTAKTVRSLMPSYVHGKSYIENFLMQYTCNFATGNSFIYL